MSIAAAKCWRRCSTVKMTSMQELYHENSRAAIVIDTPGHVGPISAAQKPS